MAYTLTDAYIAVNGTVVSNYANSITIDDQADDIALDAFAASRTRQHGQGLRDAKITASFFSDFAIDAINSILQPAYQTGATLTVEVRATSAAVSATNPNVTMTAKLYDYSGITGKAGDALSFDAEFHNADQIGPIWRIRPELLLGPTTLLGPSTLLEA